MGHGPEPGLSAPAFVQGGGRHLRIVLLPAQQVVGGDEDLVEATPGARGGTNDRSRVRRRRIGAAVLALLLFLAAGAAYLLRDPLPRFLERRSAIASVAHGPEYSDGGYVLSPVTITATSGLVVELVVRRALVDSGRTLPLAVGFQAFDRWDWATGLMCLLGTLIGIRYIVVHQLIDRPSDLQSGARGSSAGATA